MTNWNAWSGKLISTPLPELFVPLINLLPTTYIMSDINAFVFFFLFAVKRDLISSRSFSISFKVVCKLSAMKVMNTSSVAISRANKWKIYCNENEKKTFALFLTCSACTLILKTAINLMKLKFSFYVLASACNCVPTLFNVSLPISAKPV